MIKHGGHRIATSDGALLVDPESLGDRAHGEIEAWFEPAYWACRGELAQASGGRGAAWFVAGSGRWVLRHYRRGGWIARFSRDRYWWTGEARVRAFDEWRLLAALTRGGLPVPEPVAARYQRRGLWYRCDLLMQRIADARSLSALLALAPVAEDLWRSVGVTVARMHAAGADHADLNAHNILVDRGGAVSVIDFDRGRLRTPGAWQRANLSRLQRSLRKIARGLPSDRFSARAWECLLDGYASKTP